MFEKSNLKNQKMKKLLLVLLFPTLLFSQKKSEVLKKAAEFACECASKKDDVSEMSLGLCLFESLNKLNPKEQKIIGYNSAKKMQTVKKVASDLGIEMATICPDIFTKFADQKGDIVDETAYVEPPLTENYLKYTGVLDQIKTAEFNTIILLNDAKEKKEFVWLYPFEGDSLLIKDKISKGDKIEIEYREQSFYDPAKKDYRTYNEITSVKFIN